MGKRRTINRKEQMVYEEEDKEQEDQDEEEGEGEGEEEEDDAEASDEEGADDDDAGDDDDESPKKKKAKPKKKVAKPVAAKPKRTRAAKIVRMRAFWGVFNNSNAMVARFEFSQKDEADAHAAKLREEKKATYFVMQQKEAME